METLITHAFLHVTRGVRLAGDPRLVDQQISASLLNLIGVKGATSRKVTIGGLFLASVIVTVGCAQAIARHDVIERSDSRIGRAVETARGICRAQQPGALPSASEYERCVLEALRSAELTAASH